MNTTNNNKQLTGVFKGVFHYAAFSEENHRRHLEYIGANVVENTFMSDLSIAEYCEQEAPEEYTHITAAVEDTIMRSVKSWRFDEDYIIALLFAVNAKSWEHYAMQEDKYAELRAFTPEVHMQYAAYYADRYHTLYSYVMDELYNGDENAGIRSKIFHALD